jgi:quercetin dioxygenase-like cupin family protein
MIRVMFLALPLLFVGSAASAQPMNNADMKWAPAAAFAPGAQMAVLSGDPAKPGLFTVRLKMPAGYTVAPHWHPTDELVTVVEGTLSLGMGDGVDKTKSASLATGGYAVAPAKMHHYSFTGTEGATVQVTAMGPFAINYVNAADDPRKK